MILITGARGFIGQSVSKQLAQRGVPHLGVDRNGPDGFDIADPAAVDDVFQTHKFTSVIHLAAILPSACRAHPLEATRTNISGSTNVLEAAARSRVQRFVFGSSTSVYGNARDCKPVSENEPANPIDLYGAAKRYIEIYGQQQAEAHGREFVALRIATVVGPGARETASPWRSEIFEKLHTGSPQRRRT